MSGYHRAGVVGLRVEGRMLRQRKRCLRSLEQRDLGRSVRAVYVHG